LPAASGSPTARRRELGALLRRLRTEHGLTVDQVAETLMCSSSKVSRLETGQRGVSPRDIRDLCDLYGVVGEQRQRLMDLAAEGKQTTGYQGRDLHDTAYVGLEAAAKTISDFALGLVPGLLQTPDYGRAVFRAARPSLPADVIEQRLAGRLDRQKLLTSDPKRQFEALIDEAVLYRVAGDRSIMRTQLMRLLEVADFPNVNISILPYSAGLLPSHNNKFIILRFEQPALQSVVFLETLTMDQLVEKADEVAAYEEAFAAMRSVAAPPDETRDLISSAASALAF